MEPSAVMLLLEDLPIECLVEVLGHCTEEDLCRVAPTSRAICAACSEDCLWRALCVAAQQGQSLDFREQLGSFSHPDAKPLASPADPAASSSAPSPSHWKSVYRASRNSLRTTLCVDTGRGYAKFGLGASEAPDIIQICQPGAEATQQTLYPTVFHRLRLRRADLPEHAAIIAEPFRLAAAHLEEERAEWRYEQEKRLLQAYRLRNLCIVDSASLCLFSNKLTSGVVVNVGFATTFVVPVVGGRIVREAVRSDVSQREDVRWETSWEKGREK